MISLGWGCRERSRRSKSVWGEGSYGRYLFNGLGVPGPPRVFPAGHTYCALRTSVPRLGWSSPGAAGRQGLSIGLGSPCNRRPRLQSREACQSSRTAKHLKSTRPTSSASEWAKLLQDDPCWGWSVLPPLPAARCLAAVDAAAAAASAAAAVALSAYRHTTVLSMLAPPRRHHRCLPPPRERGVTDIPGGVATDKGPAMALHVHGSMESSKQASQKMHLHHWGHPSMGRSNGPALPHVHFVDKFLKTTFHCTPPPLPFDLFPFSSSSIIASASRLQVFSPVFRNSRPSDPGLATRRRPHKGKILQTRGPQLLSQASTDPGAHQTLQAATTNTPPT